MFKKYYKLFLKANEGVQHYAAHSHHYWPDVTRNAALEYWDDSAKYVDDKWDYFFSKKIPQTQNLIAKVLNLSDPKQIVFAPNTHEFVTRIISCFDQTAPVRVLTTDSEFYSFDRQINRMAENKFFHVTKVETNLFNTFEERFIKEIETASYDLIFFSQVFFNSGVAIKDLNRLVRAVQNSTTIIVIDGYHGFMALPTDLSEIQDRIFYIAGSYKYAQGGEGCCFMAVPKSSQLRPANTGWFAGFDSLTKKDRSVSYSAGGMRFAGSTMDFTALYRLNAVLTLFEKDNVNVPVIHQHIKKMQDRFRELLTSLNHPKINSKTLLINDPDWHGHFFTFEIGSEEETKSLAEFLKENKIKTDYRGSRLRFGFGLYQNDCIDLTCLKKP